METVRKTLFLFLLLLLHLLAVCTASPRSPHPIFNQQQSFGRVGRLPGLEKFVPSSSDYRLHPNVTYGPVPEEDQLFQIEFLEIAPSPVPVNQLFFVMLSGYIVNSHKEIQSQPGDDLSNATLSITASVILENGDPLHLGTITFPFRTIPLTDHVFIALRESNGAFVDHFTYTGDYDILATYWFPGWALDTGTYTFEIVASLKDETCLFALTFTQWLEHRSWWD
ncbi:hypothetical protein F5Y09DRAFT_351487 [Xylaria sp. FL1042]|nr:hypothetical protein F5Y09DRAFT_351487 [Xylaria sp. FL1042]